MTKICVRKRGFTLAEVMIVLTVIGVLTAILLPVARQSMPDENLMKFKKAHNTLGTAIRELVTSDKYYLDGDLGTKSDSTVLDRSNDNNFLYFCNTIADVVSTKEINCKKDALLYSMVLLNDKGIVAKEEIFTDRENVFAIDTEDCRFYRAEVIDETENLRIAIGNPIWNA